jgi:hypothetical protein
MTSVDPRSPTNMQNVQEKASTVIESNEQFKNFQLQDKKGLVGNTKREVPFTEKQFRKEHFDFELAKAKNRALGGEILNFEFVQAVVLFLLKKGDLSESNFEKDIQEVKMRMIKIKNTHRFCTKRARKRWVP